jgi:membrane fusion protein (multidrug efflux system)
VRAYLIAIAAVLGIFVPIGAYKYVQIAAAAGSGAETAPLVVAAALSREEEWVRYIDAVGTVRARQGVELTSETSGEVTALHFDSGDRVADGQLLVVLNDTVEVASRENQRAALELAQLLFDRDSKLLTARSIPQTQFDRSRADLQQARAQLAETEARLSQKRIAAPFAGTAGIRRIDLGDYIEPGTVITSLQDLDNLELDFTVPAQSLSLLRAGLPVEVRVDAYPDQVFKAELLAVDSRIDPGTQNLSVRARFQGGTQLMPGVFATARVAVAEQQRVVTVPETAVSHSLHGDTVHVIVPTQDGHGLTQEAVVVEPGEARDGRIVIRSGLEPGKRVVSAGQNKLYRGALVRIDESVQL